MAQRNLLIIDGNAAAAHYLKDLLQYFGHRVAVAASWDEACARLAQEAYDVLLFDEGQIHRGLGTPLNALRALGHEQPVLIMTDMALRELWAQCLHQGPVELISKPVSPSTLKFMVESALKRASASTVPRPVIRLAGLNKLAAAG